MPAPSTLNRRLSGQKKQKSHYSGKKKCHTQKAQVIVNQKTLESMAAACCNGKKHDFKLCKENDAGTCR